MNKKELFELKQVMAAFNCVPKNIAPSEDKGIYFQKAMQDLKSLILRMEAGQE